MAAIQAVAQGGNRGGRLPVRVDLTPMVDLGFLLITFFMLSTILSKPNVMGLVMPESETLNREPTKASQVITLMPDAADRIYYYEGLDMDSLRFTNFQAEGIRRVLLDKKARVDTQFPPAEARDLALPGSLKSVSKMTVIIRPTEGSRYKNLVDLLDEMKICGIAHYVLLDISEAERAALHKMKQ